MVVVVVGQCKNSGEGGEEESLWGSVFHNETVSRW